MTLRDDRKATSSGADSTNGTDGAVIAAALAWRAQDPDAETRAELDALITGALTEDAPAARAS